MSVPLCYDTTELKDLMKYFVLWLPIVAMFYLVPINVALGFMLGSFFGIIWMGYYE